MKNIALIKCRNGIWKAFDKVLQIRGLKPTLLDLFIYDDLQELLDNKWDGLIWTAKHTPRIKTLAKKIIYLFDQEKNTKVYPDWNSYWHYDDKISQYFLMKRNNIPIPDTHILYSNTEAESFFNKSTFPLVFKSAHGAGSTNVKIIRNASEAKKISNRVFGKGLNTYFKGNKQKGYLLIQKFEENNEGDYRLVCYGDEILGFFRENRDSEPLASGSKKFVFKDIPESMLNFVYGINKALNFAVMSYDLIKREDSEWVITEISSVYGDINETVYNNAQVYKLIEASWKKIEVNINHYERIAEFILDSWNKNG